MDIELYCREEGEGKPLILLHGNGESGEIFEHQFEFFSPMYHVMAIDTRGHGKSPRGTAPFTIVQFAQDLHDFMEERKIEKAYILGFSDGANIAITFALKWPEMVEKLVLDGGNIYPEGVVPRVMIPMKVIYAFMDFLSSTSEKAREKADFLRLMVKEPNITPKELNTMQVPTLVIAGTHDLILEKHTKLIYHSLPHAELAFVDGDHFIASKQPELFNKRVETFFNA